MAKTNFPTEEVNLPSKGYFYPKDNPLASGKVEMKYMTAREEDILTSPNLLKQGTAIDKLLEALIVDKKIKIADLLIGDKNALIIAARILAYGKRYDFFIYNEDGEQTTATVDLTKLFIKALSDLPSTETIILFIRLVILCTNPPVTFFNLSASTVSSFSSRCVRNLRLMSLLAFGK